MLNQGDKFGKYTIVKRIGLDERGNSTGAFATVYLVSYKDKEFVLKIPNNQEKVNNLLREIGNWARVSLHPNILTFHEAVADEGKIGFVSEYIETGSLKDWLKNSANLTLAQKLSMIEGILNGLEHLHQNSILHRDLKPDNVFVKDGTPLLADFGSAKDYDSAESQHAYGFTYWYAPPELVSIYDEFGVIAKYQLTEFDDLWSVSVIITEVLTGQYPIARMSKIVEAELRPFPPNTDQRFIGFIKKALQKDRKNRFQSIQEIREALKNPQEFVAPKVEDAGTIVDEDFDKNERLKIEQEKQSHQKAEQARLERERLEQIIEDNKRIIIEETEHTKEEEAKEKGGSKKKKAISISIGALVLMILGGLLWNLSNFSLNLAPNTISTNSKNTSLVETNKNTFVLDLEDSSNLTKLENEGLKIIHNPFPSKCEQSKLKIPKNKSTDANGVRLELIDDVSGVRSENGKPNPFMLLLEIKNNGDLSLNCEEMGNVVNNKVSERLREIFKLREENGIFKEGTNLVEKTVVFKSPPQINQEIFYQALRIIKNSGASPINLSVE